jgi:histidyl-tRNA synthetase
MTDLRAPKGMADVLPPESARWARLVGIFADHARRAGFGLVLTPLIEQMEVFQRVGESTDVVRKEMYDFVDKGGNHVAVRPEITASVMRAFAEHRPTTPWKVWTLGPNFRYESPQAARFRLHHQLDAEVVGTDDPDVDVEVVALLDGLYRALGLRDYTLHVTSLGDRVCRPGYVERLRAFLSGRAGELTAQSRETLALNPLRVLDSKRAPDQPVIDEAPKIVDNLCDDCESRFARVRAGLDTLGIGYEIAPRLVRGLDYYTRTTFEFASHAIEAAQNAIGGGGRYDGLVEALGGPPGTGGIGFGSGIERILLTCDAEGVFGVPEATIDVFVVDTVGGAEALALCDELRRAGIAADRAYDQRSMRTQMKKAGAAGARFALIIGDRELGDGMVTLRDMVASDQEFVGRADVVDDVRKRLEET